MNSLGGAHPLGISAWLLAIVGAFAVSPELGSVVAIGYLIQWTLKAPAKLQGWIAPVVAVGSCLGAYWFFHPPTTGLTQQWLQAWAMWTLAALGGGSAAGATKGAAGTNAL